MGWSTKAITFFFLLSGCVNNNPADDAVRSLGNVSGHMDVVKTAFKKIEPRTDDVGKAIAKIGHESAEKADLGVTAALHHVEQSSKKIDALQAERDRLYYHPLMSTWRWGKRIILGGLILHILLRVAGLFIAGPVGAGLATLAIFLNPFTWVQKLGDKLFYSRLVPAARKE